MTKQVQELDHVIIRFAGDSGDGMQLTGDRFTQETAVFGNDLSTLPNFPAEIRAPAGTLPGVSSFQLHFADHDILTPGDAPDVLVAMNPAALKANLKDLPRGGDLIVNTDEFTKRNLAKVGYETNPLEDGSLDGYKLHPVPLTSLTVKALEDQSISRKDAERAKNMFALGLLSWLYGRPAEGTLSFLEAKFGKKPEIYKANVTAFQAGWNYGETTEDFAVRYEVKPGPIAPGRYRNITGNLALAYGLIAAGQLAKLPLFLGSYPITPASDILHELSKHKKFGVRTFQAEDEISAASAALGASFGGSLAVTTTSGPGMLLKAETVNLAVSVELPLLVVDVQRAGPSTGMPTKTEQTDLLMALYGRNGESPVPVIAAAVPVGLLLRGDRGRPDRGHLPDAGHPAVRRVPGQRLGAVAGPRRLRAARPVGRRSPSPPRRTSPPTAPTSSRSPATRRPWPARGRSPARPALSTASAASRRPTAPGTSPTTRTTTT